MKKIGKYVWAFLVVLVLFISVGFATLGSAVSTGDSLLYATGKTAMFSLGGSKKLGAVYINVGAIYTGVGDTAEIEVEYTTASSPSTTGGSDVTPKFLLSNVYSQSGKNGYNYNWLAVATGKTLSSVRYLYFKADKNLDLNEIVAFDTDGNQIELQPYSNGSYSADELKAALDAQDSFTTSVSKYNNLSQEEALSMTAVQTLLSGKKVVDGSKYNLDGNFGILATAILAAPVAVFGNSPFALRFAPFVATCLTLVFLFLLAKDLFKSEKYAFLTATLFAIGGLATTVGAFGAGYALVACALMASAYFMYRFFSRGISSFAVVRGGMNVMLSGLFGAAAIAMETLSVIPVAAILVLFAFGVVRVKKACAIAEEKYADADNLTEEEKKESKKLALVNAYKQRIAYGFATLSFGVGTLFLLFLGGVFGYATLVKVYDASNHSMSFLSLVWTNVIDSATYSYANTYAAASQLLPLAWILPWKAATLYSASTDGSYLAWNAQLNFVACIAALVGFVFVTVKVIAAMVNKQADKKTLRIRRAWIVLLSAMVATMLSALLKGGASLTAGLVFSAAYLAFIPLALITLEEGCGGCAKAKWLSLVLLYAVLGVTVALFLLSIPSMYGFAVPTAYAKVFGWTSIVNNGFFRI